MKAALAGIVAVPVAVVLGLTILAGAQGGAAGSAAAAVGALCQTTGRVTGLEAVQARHARTIVATTQQAVASAGGGPAAQTRAELIAVMVAATESGLHDYANPGVPASELVPNDGDPAGGGDHDSVGLFQQRAGWGPLSVRMDPAGSTRLFIGRLLTVPDWQDLPPGVAAQTVQVSAYPSRYATHQAAARAWLAQIRGGLPLPHPAGPPPESMAGCGADGLPPAATAHIPPGSIPPGYTIPAAASGPERIAVTFALAQLGKPYVFDAAGPDAYDCSGLTMAAWAAAGIRLAHYTVTQWHEGTPVPDPSLLSPGDLILIPGSDGSLHPPNPQHVGMYLGEGYVIEAPETGEVVKIVPLPSFGPVIGMRHIA